MYVMNGLGQQEDYCPVAGRMCFKAAAERDTARQFCDAGYSPQRISGPCPQKVIGPDDVYRLNPCDISEFDLCSPEEDPSGQVALMVEQELANRRGEGYQTQQADAGEEVEEDQDNTMLYVGGAVALLAIGGIAYFMMQKK